jgi:hypothetical protein
MHYLQIYYFGKKQTKYAGRKNRPRVLEAKGATLRQSPGGGFRKNTVFRAWNLT